MISTQQVVQFHCLQIIRIYKQTINRSHGFHGRSPIFFLQCTKGQLISKAIYGLRTSPKKWMDEFVLLAVKSKKANKTNSNLSVHFLGESTTCQSAYGFIWQVTSKETSITRISSTPYLPSFELPLMVILRSSFLVTRIGDGCKKCYLNIFGFIQCTELLLHHQGCCM